MSRFTNKPSSASAVGENDLSHEESVTENPKEQECSNRNRDRWCWKDTSTDIKNPLVNNENHCKIVVANFQDQIGDFRD
jgi:hypothetical protein